MTVRKLSLRERVWQTYEELWIQSMQDENAEPPIGTASDAEVALDVSAGGWRVTWFAALQGGTYVARGLRLEPSGASTPDGGITTNLLRELSPSRDLAHIALPEGADLPSDAVLRIIAGRAAELSGHGEEETPSTSTRRRGGRPPVPDLELVRVAVAYINAVQAGKDGVTTLLRKELGYAKDSTVRDRIRMARERQFLSPTKQGRRSASPGVALADWLSAHQAELKGDQ